VDLAAAAEEYPNVFGLKIKGEDMSPTNSASTRIAMLIYPKFTALDRRAASGSCQPSGRAYRPDR
jgi:hypothetical protein